jgi:hypothetical protein
MLCFFISLPSNDKVGSGGFSGIADPTRFFAKSARLLSVAFRLCKVGTLFGSDDFSVVFGEGARHRLAARMAVGTASTMA